MVGVSPSMKSGVYGCGQSRKAWSQSFGERHMQSVHFILIHWHLLCRWHDGDTFRRAGMRTSTVCQECDHRVRARGTGQSFSGRAFGSMCLEVHWWAGWEKADISSEQQPRWQIRCVWR